MQLIPDNCFPHTECGRRGTFPPAWKYLGTSSAVPPIACSSIRVKSAGVSTNGDSGRRHTLGVAADARVFCLRVSAGSEWQSEGCIEARLETLISGEREFMEERGVNSPAARIETNIADSEVSDEE